MDKLTKLVKQHEFLDMYMQYVHKTESPKIMHLWSILAGASAAMGRHVAVPSGIGNLYGNQFILLVGPPGTRKSSAIGFATKLVRKFTNARFAPDDTGGQRQGLITALEGDVEDEGFQLKKKNKEEFDFLETALKATDLTDVEAHEVLGELNVRLTHPEDQHVMFAAASEFGTFMGEANSNTTRFLNKVWDGEDYDYKLRNTQQTLTQPLMTIIGGTTTSDIARILPSEAIGQGFMSRWLLVFAPNKERPVAEPELKVELEPELGATLEYLAYTLRGEILQSEEARLKLNYMYENEQIDLQDNRFIYYQERRHTHLKKLAMVLTALRRSTVITEADVDLADAILQITEARMPEALGEFGLSPIGAAKQKLLEFLQAARGPVVHGVLYTVMARDMTKRDFAQAIADLINSKKVVETTTDLGKAFVYVEDITSVFEDIVEQIESRKEKM